MVIMEDNKDGDKPVIVIGHNEKDEVARKVAVSGGKGSVSGNAEKLMYSSLVAASLVSDSFSGKLGVNHKPKEMKIPRTQSNLSDAERTARNDRRKAKKQKKQNAKNAIARSQTKIAKLAKEKRSNAKNKGKS